MFAKHVRWESKKWRDAAKGQPCTMQLEGVCNGGYETTVLAHNNGAGMGIKSDDFDAADMCSACHDVFDGRRKSTHTRPDMAERFQFARYQTTANRLRRGVVK